MFVGWFSSNGSRSGYGCCGLPFLILPLLFLFGGFGDSSMLWLGLGLLFAIFLLPRLFSFSTPAYAEAEFNKHKNEEYSESHKQKNEEYLGNSKSDEDILISADGEVLDIIDEDDSNYTQQPHDRA